MLPRILSATLSYLELVVNPVLADRAIKKSTSLGEIGEELVQVSYTGPREGKDGRVLPGGVELRFKAGIATEEVRDALKAAGFRFSKTNDDPRWWAFDDDDRVVRQFVEAFAAKPQAIYLPTSSQDDLQKGHKWVSLRMMEDYQKARRDATFMVYVSGGKSNRFYRGKEELQKRESVSRLIEEGKLSWKKWFTRNTTTGEEESESEEPSATSPAAAAKPATAYDPEEVAERLEAQAVALQPKIKHLLNPPIGQQRPTRRRSNIAGSMAKEGMFLSKQRGVLEGLANAHRNGLFKPGELLFKVRKRTEVERIVSPTYWPGNEQLKALGINDEATWKAAQERALELFRISQRTPAGSSITCQATPASAPPHVSVGVYPNCTDSNKSNEAKELERRLVGKKYAGFFPTPRELARRMAEMLELGPDMDVLEPSAGKGDLLEAVYEQGLEMSLVGQGKNRLKIKAIEPVHELATILAVKGFDVEAASFMPWVEENAGRRHFDRVIMNPPYENGTDYEHLQEAYKLLRPGGILVALVGPNYSFATRGKGVPFRRWLATISDQVEAEEKLDDAFKVAFASTGVRCVLLKIRRPSTIANDQEDLELLELEAAAAAAALALEVELKRKRLLLS